jgi:catechol 2,3-dioxygenase-like lactoylglutathione lyase family enzyme
MRTTILAGIGLFAATLASSTLQAQLPAPNAEGISTGHTHLTVAKLAESREFWLSLGAVEKSSGRLQLLSFPGMYILLREAEPSAPASATSANHIAFSIKDYAGYKAKMDAAGATYVLDNPEGGQMLADLPSGMRLEFLVNASQAEEIVFHHTHLAAIDQAALRDWYVEVFGAEVGERNGMPSAVVPGGRVDVLAVNGEAPSPTQGSAIDHIGFEVADMAAFAAKMERMGIPFNRGPERVDAINLTIAFITDPVGTYIEITEGLDDVE